MAASKLRYHLDAEYRRVYREGVEVCKMEVDTLPQRERFWNLLQWYLWNKDIPLPVAECGVYRGLSTFLMQSYWPQEQHLVDSFAGLSPRSVEDGKNKATRKGRFKCGVEQVQENLGRFSGLSYYKGWIPDVFCSIPHDSQYRFVHIDVDLYTPILKSLFYFWSKLVSGGVVVVDDYGNPKFPGAKAAVDEFCSTSGVSCVPLSVGNVVLIKR